MKNDKNIKKKTIIALDIGTNKIKLAIGKYANNKINIRKIVSLETPKSSISNGRIKDFAGIVEVIKNGLKEHGIKSHYTVVNIKSSAIINREITIPFNEDKTALDRIVHYEMKQYLAIKLDMYVTQYQIIEEFYEDKSKMIKVMVTSMEKELVESYLALVKEVGLKPYVLDVHFNTIGKVFWLYNEVIDFVEKSVAVVDIGYNSTDITIVVDGQFKMSRTVQSGTNVLEHMVKEEFNINMREQSGNEIFNDNLPQIKERVTRTLDELVEEITNVTRFFVSRDSKNEVNEVYFTGGLVKYEDLMGYLSEAVQMKRFTFKNLPKLITGLDANEDLSNHINLVGSFIRR